MEFFQRRRSGGFLRTGMDRELAKRPSGLPSDGNAPETVGGADRQRAGAGRNDTGYHQRPADRDDARWADRGWISQARTGGRRRRIVAGAVSARGEGSL